MNNSPSDFDKYPASTNVPMEGVYSSEEYSNLKSEVLVPALYLGDDEASYYSLDPTGILPVKAKLYSNRVSPVIGWKNQSVTRYPANANPDINWIMDFNTADLYTFERVVTPESENASDIPAGDVDKQIEELQKKNRVYENAPVKGPVFSQQHGSALGFDDDDNMLGYPQMERSFNEWGITDVKELGDLNTCRPVPGWPLRIQRIPLCLDSDNPLYPLMEGGNKDDVDPWSSYEEYEAGKMVSYDAGDDCGTRYFRAKVANQYEDPPLIPSSHSDCFVINEKFWIEVTEGDCGSCKEGQISGYFYTLATDPVFFKNVDIAETDDEGNPTKINPNYLNPMPLQWIGPEGLLPLSTVCGSSCPQLHVSGPDCYGASAGPAGSGLSNISRINLEGGLYIGGGIPWWAPDVCYKEGAEVKFLTNSKETCEADEDSTVYIYIARVDEPEGPPADECGNLHGDWERKCICPEDEDNCEITLGVSPVIKVSSLLDCCESLKLYEYFKPGEEYSEGDRVRFLIDPPIDEADYLEIPEDVRPSEREGTLCFEAGLSTSAAPVDEAGWIDPDWEEIDCPAKFTDFEEVTTLKMGRGLRVSSYTQSTDTGCSGQLARGTGCTFESMVEIEACPITISGVNCTGSGFQNLPITELGFNTGEFCLEVVSGEHDCKAMVNWAGFKIEGESENCCEALNFPLDYEWGETYNDYEETQANEDKVYFEPTNKCYASVAEDNTEPPVDETGEQSPNWVEIDCTPGAIELANMKRVVLGRGLKIRDYYTGSGCCDTGWAMIEACLPVISGVDCSGNAITCDTSFECLGFDTDGFCIETGENCEAQVYWGGFNVKGSLDDCCEAAPEVWEYQPDGYEEGDKVYYAENKKCYEVTEGPNYGVPVDETGEPGYGWEEIPCYDIDLYNVKGLRFGKGLKIVDAEISGCCAPAESGWARIEACGPSISGADCYGREMECAPFDCLAFDTGSFNIHTGENCETKVYWGGMAISGLTGEACCSDAVPQPGDLDFTYGVSEIRFGKGFNVVDKAYGYFCKPTGWVEVETCSPKISGIDCYHETIDCVPYECLGFDTGSFCIETGEECEAKVYWGGFSISGSNVDCCEAINLPGAWDNALGYQIGAKVYFDETNKCYESTEDDNLEIPADETGLPNAGWVEIPCDGGEGFQVDHIKNLRLGRGIRLTDYETADCCSSGGWARIETCVPSISGFVCSDSHYYDGGYNMDCTPFECLAFDTGSFCLESGENCDFKVYWGGMSVSGFTGDCCDVVGLPPQYDFELGYQDGAEVSFEGKCYTSTEDDNLEMPTDETGAVNPGWSEIPCGEQKQGFQHVKNIDFGRGLIVSDLGEGDCCSSTGSLSISVCTPKISGVDCEEEAIDCVPYDCLAFDTGSFCIETGDNCEAKVYWGGMSVSGFTGDCCDVVGLPPQYDFELGYQDGAEVSFEGKCYTSTEDDNLEMPTDETGAVNPGWSEIPCGEQKQGFQHVKNIDFGRGLIVSDLGEGDCCSSTGSLSISVCTPKISGVDCEEEAIDCVPYDCLAFDTGSFCIETGDNCEAKVYWGGMSVSGFTGDCCDVVGLPPQYDFELGYQDGAEVSFEGKCYTSTEDDNLEMPTDETGAVNPGWSEIPCGEQKQGFQHVKNIDFGRGLIVSDLGEGDCCSSTGALSISVCSPKISGVDCEEEAIDCVPYDCLGFDTGSFCIEMGDNCEAKVYWGGMSISGGTGCCEYEDGDVVEHISQIQFGKGLNIVGSGVGDCCEATGWVKVEACTPLISGVDCYGYDVEDEPFENLIFDKDGFCIEMGDNCEATVYWGGMSISGGTGCCEYEDGDVVEHISQIQFGKGLNIVGSGVGDCCEATGWVKVEACTPLISGIDCYAETIDCVPYECLGFDTGSFCIETGEDCDAKVYWGGFSILGGSGCCEYEDGGSLENVGELRFGKGINVVESGVGDCCNRGWAKLEACTPTISGVDCYGYEVEDEPFENLIFDTSDFCVTARVDCSAEVHWAGFSILGGSGCCEYEDGGSLENVGELRFGKGINVVESGVGDCCDRGWAKLEACTPTISGADCSEATVDCAPYECIAFNTDDFVVDYDADNCTANICATSNGIAVSGYEGNYPCCPPVSPVFTTITNLREIEFGEGITIISSTAGADGECCEPGTNGKVKIDACRPYIWGHDCYGVAVPAEQAFSQLNFNTNQFAVVVDSSCIATICSKPSIGSGITVSGYEDGCCEAGGELQGWDAIGAIEFGSGIIVSAASPGEAGPDCCTEGTRGNLKIDLCQSLISGEDCEGGTVDCEPLSCLGFDEDHFAVEYSECSAKIISKSAGFTVSGTTDICCEGSYEEIPYVGNLRFGKGLRISDSSAGSQSYCETVKGYAEIEACSPALPVSYLYDGCDASSSYVNTTVTGFEFGVGLDGLEVEVGPCGSKLRVKPSASMISTINDCTDLDPCINLNISGSGCNGESFVTTTCGVDSIDVVLNLPPIALDASWDSDACSPSSPTEGKITGLYFGSGLQGEVLDYTDCDGTVVNRLEVSLGGSVLSSINECTELDPCVNLNITGSFCGGYENFITTTCGAESVDVAIDITREMIEDCLNICCLEYLDHDENPQRLAVFVPDCVEDCYGCCD